jgi:hypothetical protein
MYEEKQRFCPLLKKQGICLGVGANFEQVAYLIDFFALHATIKYFGLVGSIS